MPDVFGRPYAKVSDTRKDDLVELDGGFTCIHAGAKRRIYQLGDRLYFKCRERFHGLDGQLNDDDEYVGVYHTR